MKANKKNRFFLCIILLFCISLIYLIKSSPNYVDSEETENEELIIDIVPEEVFRIELYWNYAPYSVTRENGDQLVGDVILQLNGEYVAWKQWFNLYTGSGNKIALYNKSGNLLAEYRIYCDDDNRLSIGPTNDYEYRSKEETNYNNIRDVIDAITNN